MSPEERIAKAIGLIADYISGLDVNYEGLLTEAVTELQQALDQSEDEWQETDIPLSKLLKE